tara:strand:- start:542 stop:703 length:162 start_codon:yes stop_codon:yes gene_type:complete
MVSSNVYVISALLIINIVYYRLSKRSTLKNNYFKKKFLKKVVDPVSIMMYTKV